MATPPVIQTASPLWMDTRNDHDARTYRRWLKDEWPAQGFIRTADAVLTAGPGLSVSYSEFSAIVHSADASDGAYYVYVEAGNVTLTAAHGTNPRIDLIVLTIGVDGTHYVDRVTGTPAVSPVSPSVPTQSIPICEVRVNAAATSPTSITSRKYRACKRGLSLLASGYSTQYINITGVRDIVSFTLVVPPGRTCLHVEFDVNIPALGSNVVQDMGFFGHWMVNGVNIPGPGSYSRVYAHNGASGVGAWLDQLYCRQIVSAMAPGTYTIALRLGNSASTSQYDVFAGFFTARIEY